MNMPAENSIPSIEISDEDKNENVQPPHQPRLSRSPRPYGRRQGEHISGLEGNTHKAIERSLNSLEAAAAAAGGQNNFLFGGKAGKTTRLSTSSSDSGTEADDERGLFLRGLPAPPLRSRKGLKGQNGEFAASPLLTPSYLDDESKRLELERQLDAHSNFRSSSSTDEERRKIREKFTKRRRAELLRRICEVLLLAITGVTIYLQHATVFSSASRPALLTYAVVVIGIYLLYPIRISIRQGTPPSHRGPTRYYIRIPAAFDPATLLYPVLLPFFVACSLEPSMEAVLLPNLMLGISAMPRAILPIYDGSLGQSSFHWTLSSLPLALSSKACRCPQNHCYPNNSCVSHIAEWLVLLYPLHQSLLATLGYLTTTSLLPAETQLFSISMINLLLFSESPQSSILQSLLWIGGLFIFLLCGHALRLGVALARIPTWRFRHPRLQPGDTHVLLSAIDDCFDSRLSRWIRLNTESEDSSEEKHLHYAESTVVGKQTSKRKSKNFEHTGYIENGAASIDPASGHDTDKNGLPNPTRFLQRSQRSHTLPSYLTSPYINRGQPKIKDIPKQRAAKRNQSRLTTLTNAQASVLKWVLAGYTYGVIFVIGAFPVRQYIRQQALGGSEPIGWGLGYLLGHVQTFRQSVLHWALEDWIALPEPYNGPRHSLEKVNLDDWAQGAANTRILICIYCLCIIAVGLATVFRLSGSVEVDTRRKVFHGMMVAMFLPSIFIDPAFVALAFVLVLALFLVLDLFRASQLPPLSGPLTAFLAPYVDGRDYRGPVVVSHMFLLIGCAIPLWLSLAGSELTGEGPWEGWDVKNRDLGMVSGVICVGMGDAAASLVGRRYGHRRWCWSGGKSLEGSIAFSVAVILGLAFGRVWLVWGGWDDGSADPWSLTLSKSSIAAVGASLTEAVLTGGNDNVIVPIILWLLVRGLKI